LIPDDVIDEIRARTDIVAVIGEHVTLKKAGQNHKGLCPFHHEKTPSFNVNGAKGFYYCFGCQAKGDAFNFLMQYEGRSFVEAAKQLAARVGVTVPERQLTDAEKRFRSEQSQLYEINRIAANFFKAALADERAGASARAYLQGRGISRDVAERFELGFAPDSWDALCKRLIKRNIDPRLAERAGVVRPRKSSGYYDAFRNRLVCPVVLPGGEVAGFSGRILDDDAEAAKYYNTPESPVFKKSRLLFGIHLARDGFRRSKRAIVVEGNFDVVSLHQAGFTETVAPLGTALTPEQVDQLRRLADEVVLVYDGDRAGRAATLKALRALVGAGVAVRIASLPPGEDPDSMVNARGAESFGELLDRARPGVEYFMYEVWGQSTDSADSRAQAIDEAAELLATIKDPTRRDLLIGTLASAMNVDSRLVQRSVGRHRAGDRSQAPPGNRSSQAPETSGPVPEAELKILGLLADHPKLLENPELQPDLEKIPQLLTHAQLRDMYSAARQGRPILSVLGENPSNRMAQQLLSGENSALSDPAETLREAIRTLGRQRSRDEMAKKQQMLVEAQRRGQVERQRELAVEILNLRRQVE